MIHAYTRRPASGFIRTLEVLVLQQVIMNCKYFARAEYLMFM